MLKIGFAIWHEDGTGDPEFDASLDEFSQAIEDAFGPSTGTGVYVTALGGILVAAGCAMPLIQRRRHERKQV